MKVILIFKVILIYRRLSNVAPISCHYQGHIGKTRWGPRQELGINWAIYTRVGLPEPEHIYGKFVFIIFFYSP